MVTSDPLGPLELRPVHELQRGIEQGRRCRCPRSFRPSQCSNFYTVIQHPLLYFDDDDYAGNGDDDDDDDGDCDDYDDDYDDDDGGNDDGDA